MSLREAGSGVFQTSWQVVLIHQDSSLGSLGIRNEEGSEAGPSPGTRDKFESSSLSHVGLVHLESLVQVDIRHSCFVF